MFGGGGAERRSDQETRSLLATYDYGCGTMVMDGVEHLIAQYSTCSCPMQPAMDMLESLDKALYSCDDMLNSKKEIYFYFFLFEKKSSITNQYF